MQKIQSPNKYPNWRLPYWNWCEFVSSTELRYGLSNFFTASTYPPNSTTPNPLAQFTNPIKLDNGKLCPMGWAPKMTVNGTNYSVVDDSIKVSISSQPQHITPGVQF
jgi:hypothetical protein